MTTEISPSVRQSNFGGRSEIALPQSFEKQQSQKHTVPEDKRKEHGRVNGSLELIHPKLPAPEKNT